MPIKGQTAQGKIKKEKPRPKRNIDDSSDDHSVGLWVDKDLLRKHQNRAPQTIIHGANESDGNRYLQLADVALGIHKTKKKPRTNG